ncbi:hypothetical protein ES5_10926, partial [Dietzia cinnamea P4]
RRRPPTATPTSAPAGRGTGAAAGGGGRAGGGDDDEDFLQPTPTEPERRPSRRHPTMPSWEDVLLGVRGKDD